MADLHAQLRLASAVRGVLRAISLDISTEHLLSACDDAMAAAFNANGLWIRTFTTEHHPGAERIWTTAAPTPHLDTWMRELAEAAAHEAWQNGTHLAYAVGRPSGEIQDDHARAQLDNLLRSLGIASLLFVPLGVGGVCVGGLAMARGIETPPWSGDELEAAQDLGHDIGQAVLNARRFEREQHWSPTSRPPTSRRPGWCARSRTS